MSETLSGAAGALRELGATLTGAATRTPLVDPGGAAFGDHGPGRLGDLGRALHVRWRDALDARAREAAAHGARATELGDTLARVAAGYTDVDDGASKRKPEVAL
ncbi:hypothetical protein GCM10009682_53390 [Luedemannella flava]|uniref:Excreted virulence factor EspC, type VII ESX diderm n=1 Tax=Luedemannella flava TaxID=349316 RepID=A0ABP4YQB6_9ACTN